MKLMKMMQKQILILTAGFGNGHKTAALGIAEQLKKKGIKEQIEQIEIIDIAEQYTLGKVLKWIFDHVPFWILEKLYTLTNRQSCSWFDTVFINTCFRQLNTFIHTLQKKQNPLEIYITFPMLQVLHSCVNGKAKIIIQVTDFYTPHLSWIWNWEYVSEIRLLDEHAKQYVLQHIPNINTRENQRKITVGAFPLLIHKAQNRKRKQEEKKKKGVLCFFHNVLFGNEEEIIQKLLTSIEYKNYNIIILAGKNYEKMRKIQYKNTLQNKNTIEVLGWVDSTQIMRYYTDAEIVVGKCGGAFISEIIALQKKIIVSGVFSIQEKGNLAFLKHFYPHLLVDIERV